MFECHLIVNGRNINKTVSLPQIPLKDDVVSNVNVKDQCYLVLRVEYINGYKSVNLHVKEFSNQIDASNNIKGFR